MCGKLFIRHAFWTFAALLVPLLVSSAQQAAPAHYMQQQSATAQEFENFDDFLDSHPQIAKDLSKNPSLANDEEYCKRLPQLAKFLQQHGGVKPLRRSGSGAGFAFAVIMSPICCGGLCRYLL